MSVVDHIKPIEHHALGIPQVMLFHVRNFNPQSPSWMIGIVQETYEKLLRFIEQGLHGNVPIASEEAAAEYVSHLILDAAFLHDRLTAAGVVLGKFPYDYLADRILPRKNTEEDKRDES